MATITGTSGNDVLNGTGNNDIIDGAGGIDTINAGAGDDIVRITVPPAAGTTVPSTIDGGADHDILDLSGLPGVVSALIHDTGLIETGLIGNSFTSVANARNFEEIHVGPGGSNIEIDVGAANPPTTPLGWHVVGNIGADTISDGRGADTIETGAGNDQVTFHGGNDIVDLGAGDDSYTVTQLQLSSGHAQVDGGDGVDTLSWDADSIGNTVSIDLAAGHASAENATLLISAFENLSVGEFEDGPAPVPIPDWAAQLAGDNGANHIEVFIPEGGTASVSGRGGDDVIEADGSRLTTLVAFGGAGNDKVSGTEGADWINGGGHVAGDTLAAASGDDGADTLMGFGGNDHIFGNSQNSVQGAIDGGDSIDAGSGADYVNGNGGNDTILGGAGSDRLYGGAGDDHIVGDNDADVIAGLAAPGNDHLNGNKGNDTLDGGFGNDEIHGGQDNDLLHGGEGNDLLFGDQGNDILEGGGGVDTLIGGDGTDVFSFPQINASQLPFVPSDNTPLDLVVDFQHGIDHLHFSIAVNAVVQAGSAADLLAAFDVANAALHAHAGVGDVAAVQVGADTLLFWDSDGLPGTIDNAIRLGNINAGTLAAGDFF